MFDTLSNGQLEMARSIAQYDVKSAHRYCLMIDSMNEMKCLSCKADLSERYRHLGVRMALVCEKCTPKKKKQIVVNNGLEVTLPPSDYYKVCHGKSIKIDPNIAKHQAKKIKVTNQKTRNYVMRTLVTVGDAYGGKLRGWFT